MNGIDTLEAGSRRRLPQVKIEMIDACGRASQILGLPRSVGQIYGLLYVSISPLCLDEIADILEISKGSASMGTRQLQGWNAIRQIWVQGDRKDHFEVEPELGNLLRSFHQDLVKPRILSSRQRMNRLTKAIEEDLKEGRITGSEHAILLGRLNGFSRLRKKIETLIRLGEKVL